MKIKLNSCGDDWYTVIRAEHDGREWYEEVDKDCFAFRCSERLSPDACIEGTAEEMLAVADAIKYRGMASFKRVAVEFNSNGFIFWSPKNSQHDAFVQTEDADRFAYEVIKELRKS